MDVDAALALMVIIVVSAIVIWLWAKDLERALRIGSEGARHEFVCDLCRSLRHDSGWTRKGAKWTALRNDSGQTHEGTEWTRGRVSLLMLPTGHFEMLSPFRAAVSEFTESQHTLVRAAIRTREDQ